MTNIEILKAYRFTTLEILAIHQQMEQYGIGAPAPLQGVHYDRIGGKTNDREAAQRQRMDGLEQQLTERMDTLGGIAARFEGIVASADNAFLSVILRRYYGLGETEASVAAALGVSHKTIRRARLDFLKKISG